MSYDFTVVIESDESGFHAFVPALPGCHSYGTTLDETQANIAEALELHVECMIEDGEIVPVERSPFYVSRMSVPVAV